MKRLDLAEVVLTLKASGVEDIAGFRWLEPPEPALARARGNAFEGPRRAARRDSAASRHSAAACSPSRCTRATRACCSRRTSAAACAPSRSIAALSQGRGMLRRTEGRQMEQDREDLLGEKEVVGFFHPHARLPLRGAEPITTRRSCSRLGINAVAAREAGQTCEQFLRIAKRGETRPRARRERRRGDPALRARGVYRPGRHARRCRHAPVQSRPRAPRRAGARERGAPQPAARRLRRARNPGEGGRTHRAPEHRDRDRGASGCASCCPRPFARRRRLFYDPRPAPRDRPRGRRLFRDLVLKAEVTEKVPREEAAQRPRRRGDRAALACWCIGTTPSSNGSSA